MNFYRTIISNQNHTISIKMIWNLVQTIPLSIYKTATLDQTNKTIIVLSHEQSSFHAIFRHDTAPFSK